MNDLRFAVRQLLKAPAFAAVAILSLGLGIGVCTIAFSWIQHVLIDAIPGVREPARLVVLAERQAGGRIGDTLSLPDAKDLTADTQVFQGIIGSQIEAVSVRLDASPEWLWAQTTTANFFDVLGVAPILGRGFQANEADSPGGNTVAVISHGLWTRRFHSDPSIVGRTLEISRRPFTIIGVAPEDFRGTMGGLGFDLWLPVSMSNEHDDIARALSSRGIRWLHTVARLKDDVSLRSAQAAVDAVMHRLETEFPKSNQNIGVAVLPVWKSPWGAQGKLLPLLLALAGMAVLLLILVIANLANLLLARATARDAEMAVRLALGAGAGRLIRQVLCESLLLAALGGTLGCAIAAALSHSLLWFIPTTYLPLKFEFPVDTRILAFTALISLATGLLFGLAPALRAAQASIADTLKSGGRTGSGSRQGVRLRQGLVITEVAAAFVLLVAMALCTRSFNQARHLPVGMDPDHVWIAGFRLPQGLFSTDQAATFYRRLKSSLEQLPTVESVALTDWLPLGLEDGSTTSFDIPGYLPNPGERIQSSVSLVTPAYFATLGIPILQGREFDARDHHDAPPVVVINEQLAARYLPGRNPLGLTVQIWGRPRTIIGVAKTGKYRSLNEPPRSFFYLPVEQIGDHTLAAAVRTRGEPIGLAAAIERAAVSIDPDAHPVASMPMADYMAAAYLIPKTAAILLAILGVAALFLSAMGLYGVVAASVGRRIREVGIRMALGAERSQVLWMFLRQGLGLVSIGTVLGLLTCLATNRILASLLVGVSGWDLPSYGTALPLLAGCAALACWLPARRAARIDPLVALRNE